MSLIITKADGAYHLRWQAVLGRCDMNITFQMNINPAMICQMDEHRLQDMS